MEKIFKVAILGCGSRGACYTAYMRGMKKFEIVSLCDKNEKQLEKMHSLFGLKKTEDFTQVEEFFKEKRADVLVIATDDRVHVAQCVQAMELGYDILLEKPISDNRAELEFLLSTQERTKRKVVVCHELRYGAGFDLCKKYLKAGKIGKLYAIEASERPVYWHWAQAYVRGIGASLVEGHPAILAKCSHDLDLIQSYADSECDTVSSIGGLNFFKAENAPQGAAKRCVDCKYIDSCPYSAKKVYIDAWKKNGEPKFCWPYNKVSIENPTNENALWEGISKGVYGQCVFFCPVEKVDHQMVQMQFKNGVHATLTMAYSGEPGRRIAFYGSHGEIVLDERLDTIEFMPYGGEKETIKIGTITENGNAHGGGDGVLIKELYEILSGKIVCKTPLKESVESHLMGIAAEESRLNGGILVKVHK